MLLLAKEAASRLQSLGVHSTTVRMPRLFGKEGSSIGTTEAENCADIRLLRAAPFPRLSVHDGTIITLVVVSSGSAP